LSKYFPLDSAVWGTVSDWVMVIVTFFTAIYLYRTLQAQLKITKIEELRYRKSIMPVFDVNIAPNTSCVLADGQFIVDAFFEIKLVSENKARFVFIYLPDDNEWKYSVKNQNIMKNFSSKDLFSFEAVRTGKAIPLEENKPAIEFANLSFNVEFSDELDNMYVQRVNYNRLNGFESISVASPETTGETNPVVYTYKKHEQ